MKVTRVTTIKPEPLDTVRDLVQALNRITDEGALPHFIVHNLDSIDLDNAEVYVTIQLTEEFP